MVSVTRRIVRSLLPPVLRRQHYLRLLQRAEPEADACSCRQYIRSGDCVLDIGANIGVYSKVLSAWVGDSGLVHAFEPVAETFGYLSQNVRKLGLKNVVCHNAAVSSANGLGKIMVRNGNFYQAQLSDTGEEVSLVKLDDLFAADVAFIKCDVEGHEKEVIEGATKLIDRCHPVWLVEVSQSQTIEMMQDRGYRAIHLERDWLFVS